MTSRAFVERLQRRARHAGFAIRAELAEPLEAYWRLLARWNAKISLTSLPVDDPTDEAIDRLFVEPLAAARHIDEGWTPWMDIGSGGGSPAIPIRLAKPTLRLTMVESRARKAAFLREAVRTLGLGQAAVENIRFEELAVAEKLTAAFGLVTVRAVRTDPDLIAAIGRILRRGGRLVLFRPTASESAYSGFERVCSVRLLQQPHGAYLAIFNRHVPRGTA